MRKCSKCKIEKPLDLFPADKTQKEGRSYACSACKNAYLREYARKKNFEVVNDPEIKRACTDCHRYLEITQFSIDRKLTMGRSYRCKECHSAFTKCKRTGKRYDVKKRFKITLEEYDNWMKAGKCEICSSTEHLVLDHDHVTGKIRGCLCHRCNVGLGSFLDNADQLMQAAGYLKRKAEQINVPLSDV